MTYLGEWPKVIGLEVNLHLWVEPKSETISETSDHLKLFLTRRCQPALN